MPDIPLFRADARKLTFRPDDEGPAAIIRAPDGAQVDPATDELYVPRGRDIDTYRPGGAYLAAKSAMFGFRLMDENRTANAFRPITQDTPGPPPPRKRKSKA